MTSEVLTEPKHYKPRKPGFDPSPLLRQLELTLPDLREPPLRSRQMAPSLWDGKHRVLDRQIADALGTNWRRVQRLRRGARLSWVDADRLATRCGLHPALIWPDWYAA